MPIDTESPEVLVAAIRKRRGGELSELDRLLLHSSPLADGWNNYLGVVRTKLSISPMLRELAMCVVAVVNEASYELEAHLPLFIQHGGSQEQANAIRNLDSTLFDPHAFDDIGRATLQLSYEMTKTVSVRQETFDAARSALGSNELMVELVGVIAAYNMVSRFLVAFELHQK